MSVPPTRALDEESEPVAGSVPVGAGGRSPVSPPTNVVVGASVVPGSVVPGAVVVGASVVPGGSVVAGAVVGGAVVAGAVVGGAVVAGAVVVGASVVVGACVVVGAAVVVVTTTMQLPVPVAVLVAPLDHVPNTVSDVPEKLTVVEPPAGMLPEWP
jgi:hypothetical protein